MARRDPILEIRAVEAEHQDDRQYQAGAQYGVQISEKLVHGSSPCLSRRRVRPGAGDAAMPAHGGNASFLSATASSETASPFFSITGTDRQSTRLNSSH